MSTTLEHEHPIYDDVIVETESGSLISAVEVESIAARPGWDTNRQIAASREAPEVVDIFDVRKRAQEWLNENPERSLAEPYAVALEATESEMVVDESGAEVEE